MNINKIITIGILNSFIWTLLTCFLSFSLLVSSEHNCSLIDSNMSYISLIIDQLNNHCCYLYGAINLIFLLVSTLILIYGCYIKSRLVIKSFFVVTRFINITNVSLLVLALVIQNDISYEIFYFNLGFYVIIMTLMIIESMITFINIHDKAKSHHLEYQYVENRVRFNES